MQIIIKQVRNDCGVSQEELSDDTGIDRHRLSELENNQVKVEDILFLEMYLISQTLRQDHRRFVCK